MRVALLLMLAGCTGVALEMDAGAESEDASIIEADAGQPTVDAGPVVVVVPDAGPPRPRISGRQLFVGESPFEVRAVGWNPVKKGQSHPGGIDFTGTVETDATMMVAAGFNTVRTYVPIVDRAVLDALHRHGLMVLNTVYSYGGEPASVATERVRAVADHPAMLGWLVGNEWNYNGLYVGLSFADSRTRLNEVMALIRAADSRALPIINVYGELPNVDTIEAMPLTDIWAINSYRGLSFGNLFTTWTARSSKPMMLGEYGADAWNANINAEDQASQAMATQALTAEIHAQWSGDGGVAVGGSLFEWCDEWWKDGAGRNDVHDVGGIAPGGGPYPDQTFNEEWWGLVDIDRHPRSALQAATRGWGL